MLIHDNESFLAHLSVFNGKSYDEWIVKMKVIFIYQYVLDVVNDIIPTLARNATEVQQTANKDTKKKHGNAMFLIH